MALQLQELFEKSDEIIDSNSKQLFDLNHKIWLKPELGYEEHYAHEVLTDFLSSKGFNVERHYKLKTGFRAEFGEGNGPTVAVLSEMDALPGIGHGCGHNLIAESGVAAGLGIKEVLEKTSLQGKVVVMGTPAEEGGGGKIDLINAGCFKDVDFCMMLHPAPFEVPFYKCQANNEVFATYHGKSVHAVGQTHKGINALDAAVMAYNNISVLRQQFKPTWSVHGIFTEAGKKPNVIPDRAQLHYFVRTTTNSDSEILKLKVQKCMEGAATATGTTVDIKWQPNAFAAIETNVLLAQTYQKHAESLGVQFPLSREEQEAIIDGSTDMGNVTLEVPGIHPLYCIKPDLPYHSNEFRVFAETQEAHEKTLTSSKAIARTAIEVLADSGLMQEMKNEFNQMKSRNVKNLIE